MLENTKVILASASPRRRELLAKIKKKFKIVMMLLLLSVILFISAIVNFVKGNIFQGCIGLIPIAVYTILLLKSKNTWSPLLNIIEEYEEMEEASLNMNAEEFLKLTDEDLVVMMNIRIDKQMDDAEPEECLELLDGAKKVFYVAAYFEQEICNGGLCQFFVNSSRVLAPLVGESLKAIGAKEYNELYNDFVNENKIDLTDLSSFITNDADNYEKQYDRYDFEKFDNAFCELLEEKSLDSILAKYVRENMEDVYK